MKKVVLNSTIEAAVANQGGATFSSAKPMEAETISKNRRSSKCRKDDVRNWRQRCRYRHFDNYFNVDRSICKMLKTNI